MAFKYLRLKKMKHPELKYELEYLEKEDGVAALILNSTLNKILLVKQFRAGVKKELFEVPAGILEYGILPKDGIAKEIVEETGFSISNLDIIYEAKSPLPVSPGYTEERIYIFIYKLKNDSVLPRSLNLDIGEKLEPSWVTFKQFENIESDLKTNYIINLFKLLKSRGDI